MKPPRQGSDFQMTIPDNAETLFSGIVQSDEISAPRPVFTGDACNLHCAYCPARSPRAPRTADPRSILEQLRSAASDHVPAIIFSGGEPTLHKSLPALVSVAKELSIPFVGIRTNAMTLSYSGYTQKLCNSGLSFVQVSSFMADGDQFDRIAQTPGAHEKVMAGIATALGAGLRVSVTIPLLGSTFSTVADDIERVLTAFTGIRTLELRAVGYDAPDCNPVSIPEMNRELPGLVEQCRAHGAHLSFGPFEGIPPCLFHRPEALLPLFRYPAASFYPRPCYEKAPVCAGCPLDSLCNGIRVEYAGHFREPGVQTPGQRVSAAIARGAVLKSCGPDREAPRDRLPSEDNAVTISYRDTPGGESLVNDCIIRTNYRCNLDCLFCFVDIRADGPPEEVLRNAAQQLIESNKTISIVSFSGGEPTLNPHLPELVTLFHEAGALEICLQTNATLMSDPERARSLTACGIDSAFVSLHSHDEIVSDIITGVPGAFRRTLEGIANLSANGAFVYLSHVINSFNFATLPEFVRFVHDHLGKMAIVFSFAAPHTSEMMFGGSIPRLAAIREPLKQALELCLELEIPFSGLPGMCGLPLCLLGPDMRFYPDIHPVNQEAIRGAMHKNAGCGTCSLNDWCYGLRAFYFAMFGDAELTPVRIRGFAPVLRDTENRLEFFKKFYG